MHLSPFRRRGRRPSLARELSLIGLAFVIAVTGIYGLRNYIPWEIAGEPEPTRRPAGVERRVGFSMCVRGRGVNCVIDGDTIRMDDRLMRIENIDAPETHRNFCGGAREEALGHRSAARLREILNSGPIALRTNGEDRYGRPLIRITVNGHDVGEILIAERLARRWPDGEEFWCDR